MKYKELQSNSVPWETSKEVINMLDMEEFSAILALAYEEC